MSYRVFRMWYRILRKYGTPRGAAIIAAWRFRKPTMTAIGEYGGME